MRASRWFARRAAEESTGRVFALKRMAKSAALQCPDHVFCEQHITRNIAHPFCLRQYASFQVPSGRHGATRAAPQAAAERLPQPSLAMQRAPAVAAAAAAAAAARVWLLAVCRTGQVPPVHAIRPHARRRSDGRAGGGGQGAAVGRSGWELGGRSSWEVAGRWLGRHGAGEGVDERGGGACLR
jgi:hypothetical protein